MSLLDRARKKFLKAKPGEAPLVESAEDQSTDDRELVMLVKKGVEDARRGSRIANEGIWMTNIAYLVGYDSIFFDTQTREYRPVNAGESFLQRDRVHENKILPTCQSRLAKLTKNPPRYEVKPKSADPEDRDAARLGKQIIGQVWDNNRMNLKRQELLMYVQQCGHAYIRTFWDKTKGRKLPYSDEEGERLVAEGEIANEVVSAFEVFPNPAAKNFEEVQETFLTTARVRPLAYFRKHFDRGALVKEEANWLQSLQNLQQVNSMTADMGLGGGGGEQLKDAAIELARYEAPTDEHPGGRLLVVANGFLLHSGPLDIDEIPFAKFDDIIIGGKYNSEAVITHLRPLQDQKNRNLNKQAQWVDKLLAGKYLAARGHGLIPGALNDQSGEVIEYDHIPGQSEPHAMVVPQMPSYVFEMDANLDRKFDTVSGVNEISRGTLPTGGGNMPAIGMQFLVEQDDTRAGVETENHEQGYADVGRHILKYAADFYETDRLLYEAGEDMEYTVKSVKGEDIRGNFNVSVVRGSTLPGSRVLDRQETLNLYDRGLLGNPADPTTQARVIEDLEYGELSPKHKKLALQKRQIKKKIMQLEKGEKPVVLEYDNHALTVSEMDDFRLSDKFERLDDEKTKLFFETMEEHLSHLVDQVAPQVTQEADALKLMEGGGDEIVDDESFKQSIESLEMQGMPLNGSEQQEITQNQVEQQQPDPMEGIM